MLSSSVHSQISKGQWIVGGIADFYYSNSGGKANGIDNDIKTTSLESSLGGGYFFRDRFCAGIRVGIITTHTKQIVNGREVPPVAGFFYINILCYCISEKDATIDM